MNSQRIIIIIAVIVGILAIFVLSRTVFRNDFPLPQNGETKKETVTVSDGGKSFSTKEIMVTDGVKHSVPLDEIIGGGPPKDGIPSIDNPKFISVAEASKVLNDSEPGIALDINGTARFYPFQILVWHEIVNDTINGQRVLVTYCPLCLSGIVFDPSVKRICPPITIFLRFGAAFTIIGSTTWNRLMLSLSCSSDSLLIFLGLYSEGLSSLIGT